MKISNKYAIGVLFFVLLLAAIDFGGIGIYIMSFLGLLVLVFFPNDFKHCIREKMFLKFAFLCIYCTVIYCIMTSTLNRSFVAGQILMPISMYLCGHCIINCSKDKERALRSTILISAAVCSVYGFLTAMNKGDLSAYSNYSEAYINNLMRQSKSLWTGNTVAGTVLSLLFIPSIAVLFYTLTCLKGMKRICLGVCSVLAIAASFLLGSRANLGILMTVLIVSTLVLLLNLRHQQGHKMLKRVCFFSVVALLCIMLNVFQIRDRIMSSTLFYRLQIMDYSLLESDGRTNIFRDYILLIAKNPVGGLSLSTGHSAHNTILQFGAFAGVMGLVLAVWFFLPLFFKLFKAAWKDDTNTKYLTLPLVVAILLIFMVESVIISNSIMYSVMIMYLIMIYQYYREKYARRTSI